MSEARDSDDSGRSDTIDDETVVLQRVTLAQDQTLTIIRPRPGHGDVSDSSTGDVRPDSAMPGGEATSADVSTGTIPLHDRMQKISALGRGSMGEVWIARDKGLNRRVAFKQMLATHAGNADMTSRFFEEVQVTAQLDHPNVLPIYNLECTQEGAPAYSMKLVQGRTLTDLLHQSAEELETHGGDPRERLAQHLDIFLRICEGMAYAHSKGVLHRDLKPDNVMVGRFNEVYIMDWGISRVMSQPEPSADVSANDTLLVSVNESESDRTQLGAVIGTPAYMSPEQALGLNDALDQRSDIYSLGLLLQEMVSLKRARPAAQVRVMIRRAGRGEREKLPARVGRLAIAKELRAIVNQATALKIEDRYATVQAMAADVRRFLRGEAVLAEPDTPMQALLRFIGHHQQGMLLSLIGVVVLAALGLGLVEWRAEKRQLTVELEQEGLNQFVMLGMRRQKELDDLLATYSKAGTMFAGRVLQWLIAPSDQSAPYFTDSDFTHSQVPGLAYSDYYGIPVSFQVPVVRFPPETESAQKSLAPTIARVGLLNEAFRNVIIRGASVDPENMASEEIEHLLTSGVSPIHQASFTLTNGLYVAFPGNNRYAADYDPLRRPKYQLGEKRAGLHWGEPYVERHGKGLLLPGSIGLFDDQHRFRGVATIDLRFDRLASHMLRATYPRFVREVLVLAFNGEVLIRAKPDPEGLSSAMTSAGPGPTSSDGRTPATALPDARAQFQGLRDMVVTAADERRPIFEYFDRFDLKIVHDFGAVNLPDENLYIGFFYLHSVEWFMVVVADRQGLIDHYAAERERFDRRVRVLGVPAFTSPADR